LARAFGGDLLTDLRGLLARDVPFAFALLAVIIRPFVSDVSQVALSVFIPEPFVARHPVPHQLELRRDKAIAPHFAVPLLRHETGIGQDAAMLPDGRLISKQPSIALAERSASTRIEHPATRCAWLVAPEISGSQSGVATMLPA
jgi:hypothetical protein